MSLLTVAEARVLVKTGITDANLQAVINREEAVVTDLYGAHYVDVNTTVVETLSGGGASLFLRRPLTSVTSVVEDGVTLTTSDYRAWGKQGRIERLPGGSKWLAGVVITVTLVPYNDNERRKAAIIELVRLAVQRTTMKSESVAGEYSYTAPGWDTARRAVLRGLGFPSV